MRVLAVCILDRKTVGEKGMRAFRDIGNLTPELSRTV